MGPDYGWRMREQIVNDQRPHVKLKRTPTTWTAQGLAALAVLVACFDRQAGESGRPGDFILDEPTTIVSLGSNLLGAPSGMAIDSAGRVWIGDFIERRLLSVEPDGSDPRQIGSEGEGPGEFRAPLDVVATAGSIRVADGGNNRIQEYSLAGTHLGDFAANVPRIGGAALHPDGRYVITGLGMDSTLLILRSLHSSLVVNIGSPVVPLGGHRSASEQLRDIRDGRVPTEQRNQTITAIGAGAVYALLLTEAEVRKYSDSGDLLWTAALDVPEVDSLRFAYFRAHVDSALSMPRVLVTLQSGREVGADFWVLVRGLGKFQSTLYVLNGVDGTLKARIRIPSGSPALRFAVDQLGNRIYLSVPDEASIVVAAIAQALSCVSLALCPN